ncbi:von Willebrand factor type A domain-containing protein [Neisseria sp.]|uniref:vWA domain-containing protein n=1 Tax=Neisseria sp. TaxID=192066 RepID=UPI00359FDB6C
MFPRRFAVSALTSALFLAACSSPAPDAAETVNNHIGEPQAAAVPQAAMRSKAVAPMMDARAGIGGKTVMITMPVPESMRPVQNTEKYGEIQTNPVHAVAQTPVSTFSIDVDTGSYANVRRFLNDGRLPPADAVRVEEIINYFDYRYPQPTGGKPFAVHTETVVSPWQENAEIIKIGIQAKDLAQKSLPPANLVFLVDVSGSMNAENKLPLVKQTLRLLTEQLRPQDKVTLITYAAGEKVVLPPTSGKEKDTILRAINELQAGGATAGERAIQTAYKEAQKAYVKNGINRILLATDGDFNVGITDFNTLKSMVAEKRKSGISLTTLGFGTGNYNEHLMEQLADAGDGNYSYIDNRNEAKKVLQRQLTSTLATVAQDVKIQVEFNPAAVKEYRLIGYENRALKQEDFNNDKVDAGDIGAGHSVTALYEIIPAGKKGWLAESRYQATPKVSDGLSNEYAFVKLRYKLPGQNQSILISQPVAKGSKPLSQASADTRLALAAASYGQQLRGGQYSGKTDWNGILSLAQSAANPDPYGLREEFVELVKTAKSLSAKKPE